MRVIKSDIPEKSLTNQFFPVDYFDAYTCRVITKKSLSADQLQIESWTVMPKWVVALFKLRNILVRPFGLKSDEIADRNTKLKSMIINGGSVGVMSLVAKSDNETILMLSDRHLDAYASIYTENEKESQIITTITLVRFHNTFGRIYFTVIKPFHKIVVKAGMRSTLKRIISRGE